MSSANENHEVIEKHYSSKESANDIRSLKELIEEKNWTFLKKLIRSRGWRAEDVIRKELWTELAKAGKRPLPQDINEHYNIETASPLPTVATTTTKFGKLPAFVDPNYCRFFHLNADERSQVDSIIWSLARCHPEITYSPLLYPLTALFLHFHDAKSTYISMRYLLEAPASGFHVNDGQQKLLPTSKTQIIKDAYVLIKLTNQFGILPMRRFFSEQRKKLKKDNDIDAAFLEWLKWIFIGLPFNHLVRVVDCYLMEGSKFLFRIALALLLLYRKSFPTSKFIFGAGTDPGAEFTLQKMLDFCERIKLSPNELIDFSLNIPRFRRSRIYQEYRKAESNLPHSSALTLLGSPYLSSPKRGDMMQTELIRLSSITRIVPQNLHSSILNYYLLDTLWDWIPERFIVKEAKIIFCTNEDGNSLTTFYAKTEKIEPTILIVKTDTDEVFGAFCSNSWAKRNEVDEKGTLNAYFGTGETFLFTLNPKPAYYPWIGTKESGRSLKLENIPHSSQLFMSGDSKMISIGAGNGIGLWLNENLTTGTTAHCDTFENRPLASTDTFNVTVVEVIGFLD